MLVHNTVAYSVGYQRLCKERKGLVTLRMTNQITVWSIACSIARTFDPVGKQPRDKVGWGLRLDVELRGVVVAYGLVSCSR